jgi:hypothetical protein
MSGFVLKMIALASMFVDHTGFAFSALYDTNILRGIGRLAFPIYVFLIAEGCRKTSSISKYAIRLGIFAIISEMPFDLFSGNVHSYQGLSNLSILDFSSQNVFFTLALGVVAIMLAKKLQKGIMAAVVPIAILAVVLLGDFLGTDYGSAGVFFILLMHLAAPKEEPVLSSSNKGQWQPEHEENHSVYEAAYPNSLSPSQTIKPESNSGFSLFNPKRIPQAIVLLLLSVYFYLYKFMPWEFIVEQLRFGLENSMSLMSKFSYSIILIFNSISDFSRLLFLFGAAPAVLILFYNGRRGRKLKWAFYIAYPIHLLVLAAVWLFYIHPQI